MACLILSLFWRPRYRRGAGPSVSQVVGSENPTYPVGTLLFSMKGWQEYSVLNPQAEGHPVAVIADGIDPAQALSVLGPNGLAAWFGLAKVIKPQPGETVVVSGAAGSTGSVAAQIAKIKGCRVIGIAGGPDKCRWLTEELGIDHAIDYKNQSVEEELRRLAPNGVDAFFDNVGGDTLSAVVENMAVHGRIALCGQIATYNDDGRTTAPLNVMKLVYWRVRIEGFIMSDRWEEMPAALEEIAGWIAEGRMKHREDIRHGFETIPAVFAELFAGTNEGTLLMKLADKEAIG
ncbi:MAG: NADP-dependent oxidoreductase [Alphaproteobacteria bacterium]|nr:MAG: NADP-dependent oxidoreductase [Alphaproteobacteria bacterium]